MRLNFRPDTGSMTVMAERESVAGVLRRRDFMPRRTSDSQRSEPRVRVDRTIVMIPFGFRTGLLFQPARLIDCSRSGVGVVAGNPLSIGNQFMLKAKLKEFVLLIYTVRNCQPWQGGYRIGGQFSGIIGPPDERDPSDVLDALLGGE